MPRKPTGTLIWHRSGWHARYWAVVDGERKRVFVDLETQNELIANDKLAALIRSGGVEVEAATIETFEQAAERIGELRSRTLSSALAETKCLRKHVVPAIGRMRVDHIEKQDVMRVLEAVRDKGLSAQSIVHISKGMRAVFKQLRKEGVLAVLPMPEADELPEALPDSVDDRPKAVLSDDELLAYLAYTDPRPAEKFRGAVRERQMMALLARCVGGMRTAEISGLQWARARCDDRAFDALEVIRYKTRRKAAKKNSKAVSRQLYPLGDTVLPMFLRFWYMRREKLEGRAPSGSDLLFPVRRARRLEASAKGEVSDRVGEKRGVTSFARALRRDLEAAFTAAKPGTAPAPGSQRWAELLDGTDDRKALHFHNARNAAAVASERLQRLQGAAKFTGHASGAMLQHYREMAGEIDVVPMFPELLPDAGRLGEVLVAWCVAEGLDVGAVMHGAPNAGTPSDPGGDDPNKVPEKAYGKVTRVESASKSASASGLLPAKIAVFSRENGRIIGLRRRVLYPSELQGRVLAEACPVQRGRDCSRRAPPWRAPPAHSAVAATPVTAPARLRAQAMARKDANTVLSCTPTP